MLTPNLPVCVPHTSDYRDQEHAMVDYNGNVKDTKQRKILIGTISTASEVKSNPKICEQFMSAVQTLGKTVSVSGVNSVHQKGRVDALKLSQ